MSTNNKKKFLTLSERLQLSNANADSTQNNIQNNNFQSNNTKNIKTLSERLGVTTAPFDATSRYETAKFNREMLDKEYQAKYNEKLGTPPNFKFENPNLKKESLNNVKKGDFKNAFPTEPEYLTEYKNKKQEYNKAVKDFYNSSDIKQLQKKWIQARNEELFAEYEKDSEEINNQDSSFWDKNIITNFLRGAGSLVAPIVNSHKYITTENGRYYLPTKSDLKMQKAREDSGWLGRAGIDISYNTGKILGSQAINAVSGGYAGSALYYGNMFINSANDAISKGYDNSNALSYALASTGTEFLTGKLLGTATKGLTKGNILELDDAVTNLLMQKFGANKTFSKVIGNAFSEGTEEFIQEYLENFNKLMFLDKNTNIKDYADIITNKDILVDALYSAGIGAASGGILGTMNSNQNVYDIYRNQLTELRQNTTDTKTINQIDSILKEIDNVKYSTTRNENVESDIDKVRNYVKSNETTTNIPTVQDLVNRADNPFKYEKTDNQKINNLRESASKYFDNSEKTNSLVNTYEKIIEDKNYNIVFDDSITNNKGDAVNGKITTLKNGEVEIRVNPNSNRAGEFIIMHELTHAIETKSMKDLVLKYASKHTEFNEALKSLQMTYGTNDVSSEVLADISGELFGNQEFINSLSLEQPSIFRRIYNSIISLANKITGNSNEALFLRDLKNKWENAYRNITQEQAINNISNTKFSEIYNNDGTINRIKINENIFENNKKNSISKTIEEYLKQHIGEVYTIIESGQKIYLGQDLPSEYAYSKSAQSLSTTEKLAKGRAASNLQEIVENANNRRWQKNSKNKHNVDAKYGFYRYDTTFSFDYKGKEKIYTGTILIRNDINGKKYLYDILNIHPQKKLDNLPSVASNSNKSSAIIDGSSNQSINNIPQSNNNVNSGTKYSMQESVNNTQNLKQQQLNIILNSNPAGNDTATWIRHIDDIKTFQETLQDSDWVDYVDEGFNPDYTGDMVQEALDSGKIIVYSSYPIEQGIFVTPSKMEAESYSGTGKVYSKEVSLEDVAWIDPTQGQYAKIDSKYSQNSGKWQQYLEKYYKATGTRINMQDILLSTKEEVTQNIAPVSEQATTTSNRSNLTSEELAELEILKTIDDKGINLDEEETKRMQYLENKSKGLIKYPELSPEITYDDIKSKYSKYKDLTDFDSKILDTAKSFVEGYQNTGRRTKQQWLEIANFIGSNLNAKTSEALEKYAIQSWHDAKPNTKETLNRQSQKYVKFTIDEWVNAVYKGAGVGTIMQEAKVDNSQIAPVANEDIAPTAKPSQKYSQNDLDNFLTFEDKNNNEVKLPDDLGIYLVENTNIEPQEVMGIQQFLDNADVKTTNNQTTYTTRIGNYDYIITTNKVNDTNVVNDMKKISIQKLPSIKEQAVNNYQDVVNNYADYKESKFYENATETSQFITKENRDKLKNVADLEYYKGISNEETLKQAQTKIDKGGVGEIGRWLTQDDKISDATDIAEGWILLSRYQEAGDYDSMVAIAKKMRRMGTTAGQAVQAYNIMARLTPEGMVKYAQSELTEAYEIYSKNKSKTWIDKNSSKFDLTPEETGYIVNTMKEVEKMPDSREKTVKLAEIQKMLNDKLPPDRGDSIKAWMRISMLFNPKTQVRNVMGNAVIAPVNMVSDFISSKVDSAIAKKTGVRTTGTTSLKSYIKGFKKGLFESYDDFKRGINTRDMQGNRFEVGDAKSFNDNTAIGKSLNKVDNLLEFMLDAGDRGFYEASFTNSINNQMVLNNKTEVTQDMIDIATKEALQRTWQDSNDYTRFVLNVRNTMNKINVKGYGLGDVLIPFAKTPANLTKAIVDYSPLGMVKTINEGINLKKSLSNGQYNAQMQHQFVQDLGKATAGTMLYIAGVALANAGVTSGESDDDKDVSNFMKNTLGVSSYSIKIGNKTFSYDWAQPVAAPLAITANIVNKQKQNANLLENITSSLDTAGNILLEQSFLDSLNTVFTNNDGIVTGLEEAIMELPSRAIPTFMKQITDMIDTTQRTSFEYDKPLESMVNKIKVKIPGLSQTLAPTVDTMGREIQKYGGKANIFNVFLNPANVNTENISKSAEEIYRLYKKTGNTTIMPRVAPYYINQDGEKINLNSSQRTQYQKVSGKIIEDGIKELLKSSSYKEMTDDKQSETIADLVNYSYNIAKKEVLNFDLSNTYQKAYEYSKIGNVSDYYSFKNVIDNADKDTKRDSITNYLLNSDLDDKQLAYLYGNYYSNEDTLNNILNANISMKEFIKFNSQEFKNDYNSAGKAIKNSAKNKVINYVNNLQLSVPQKALLIKSKYNSYNSYNNQIVDYIKSQNIDFLDKARILKMVGFTSFDKEIINNVNQRNLSVAEKTKILEDMGFKVRDGRVYSK